MMDLMVRLEPRYEEGDTILLNELDEINEVIYFIKGCYLVGYEINTEIKYIIEFERGMAIGAYGATFN